MPRRRSGSLCNILFVLGAAAALSACSHAEAVIGQPAPENPASTTTTTLLPVNSELPPAPPVRMTREKASTDCWMKYEKEGRGLSLDQRLPLVEKCTAEKLKSAGR